MTIDHGLDNLLAADIDGISYWYQEEPHIPFEPLPPVRQRRPISTAGNRMIMAAPLIYAAAAYGIVRGVKKKVIWSFFLGFFFHGDRNAGRLGDIPGHLGLPALHAYWARRRFR